MLVIRTLLPLLGSGLTCVLCLYALRMKAVRDPAILLLVSNILSGLFRLETFPYQGQPVVILLRLNDDLLHATNRGIVLTSTALALIGVAWLLLIVVRVNRMAPIPTQKREAESLP